MDFKNLLLLKSCLILKVNEVLSVLLKLVIVIIRMLLKLIQMFIGHWPNWIKVLFVNIFLFIFKLSLRLIMSIV